MLSMTSSVTLVEVTLEVTSIWGAALFTSTIVAEVPTSSEKSTFGRRPTSRVTSRLAVENPFAVIEMVYLSGGRFAKR